MKARVTVLPKRVLSKTVLDLKTVQNHPLIELTNVMKIMILNKTVMVTICLMKILRIEPYSKIHSRDLSLV